LVTARHNIIGAWQLQVLRLSRLLCELIGDVRLVSNEASSPLATLLWLLLDASQWKFTGDDHDANHILTK
jgi:hypothetical protein